LLSCLRAPGNARSSNAPGYTRAVQAMHGLRPLTRVVCAWACGVPSVSVQHGATQDAQAQAANARSVWQGAYFHRVCVISQDQTDKIIAHCVWCMPRDCLRPCAAAPRPVTVFWSGGRHQSRGTEHGLQQLWLHCAGSRHKRAKEAGQDGSARCRRRTR